MKPFKSKSVRISLLLACLSCSVHAAVVDITFDQFSKVYAGSSLTSPLLNGSYFGFGSFNSTFDMGTITQANLLATLRNTTAWTKSFETGLLNTDDESYTISATAASSAGQYAYAIYINDTLANVQQALLGSSAGVSTEFGIFTYTNTSAGGRAVIPRDPTSFADATAFSTLYGLPAGRNNFSAVSGLGSIDVASNAIVLIPEPATGSLLLLGAGLLGLLRRKTNV